MQNYQEHITMLYVQICAVKSVHTKIYRILQQIYN